MTQPRTHQTPELSGVFGVVMHMMHSSHQCQRSQPERGVPSTATDTSTFMGGYGGEQTVC